MRSWAMPAAAIVAAEYFFALLIGAKAGFHYRIPFSDYAEIGGGIALFGVWAFALVQLVRYARARAKSPIRGLLSDLPRCFPFVVGTFLVAVQMGALTWTKIMLPIAEPFWADPYLATVDRAVFHAEPWKLAHAVFGWASPLVDGAYVSWVLIKFTTLAVVLALPESRRKTRALVAYFLIMAMTAIGQYALSSGGPVFYRRLGFGERFNELTIEPWVKVTTSYLWDGYLHNSGEIGAGISAMPSLHVAISLWVALVLRSYAPRFAVAGYLFFALILIGSVLLGWHYAADGIVATAITLVAWHLARYAVQPNEANVRTAALAGSVR